MRYVSYRLDGRAGLGVLEGQDLRGRFVDDPHYPGDLAALFSLGGDALAEA